MSQPLQRFAQFIAPFILIGVAIAFAFAMVILVSYLLLWGIGIALLLALGSYLKQRFGSKSTVRIHRNDSQNQKGRVIEHDSL